MTGYGTRLCDDVRRRRFLAALVFWVGFSASSAFSSDWATYRHDIQRSGVTRESLSFPLAKAWTYTCPQRPRPAWAAQPALLNRVDFDYAPQVVVSGGMVFFGSSADDTLRALDLSTGRERWRHIAGGPIRFAPQVHAGKVYFAADDGRVYCLRAEDGKRIWSFQAAPWDDRMVGNHRVISRWPCRTGVLVQDDTVYATAGLWPSDGIYIYALDAESGQVKWVNDGGGYVGRAFSDTVGGAHQGEFIFTYLCPQGPLLASGNVLVVPQGHVNPARFDAKTGQLLRSERLGEAGRENVNRAVERYVEAGNPSPTPEELARIQRSVMERGRGYPGSGGTWCAIANNKMYVLAMHRSRTVFLNSWDVESVSTTR